MDVKIINGIRSLAIDMINEAECGHPGICLGAAPTIYSLFMYHLNFNKEDGAWLNRDRFVLSAGHGSALLYSTLFYSGYNIELEDLKKFRRKGSKTPGYPELNTKLGIEMSTGLLGEGLASAVGMAIGEEYLRHTLGSELVSHYTYVLVSDGDLMEGVSYEAVSLAGSLKLNKLIVLYDSNDITLDGKINGVFNEDIVKRFDSMGWHVEVVQNGEDYMAINNAISKSKTIQDKPSLVIVKTVIGIGTSVQGTSEAHAKPLSDDDIFRVKDKMNISRVPFHVSKDAVTYFRENLDKRISPIYNEWVSRYNSVMERLPEKKKILELLEDGTKISLKNLQINFDSSLKEDMRITNSNLMNVISTLAPTFIGGGADIVKSTMTYLDKAGDFKLNSSNGKNIHFGVRESVMGSILNGLALTGLRPFCSTFLAFSDYMKPAIRMSAMMNLPVIYIFTHDSLKIGSDGPTHIPIEQLGTLRSIPNMTVFRPADVNELVGSWDYIMSKKSPSALIIPKEEKGLLQVSSIEGTTRGGYIIRKEMGGLSGIIISTGSDVETAIEVSDALTRQGIMTRVVSMPSVEVFNMQSSEYKESILPSGIKIIVIEASNDSIWYSFVYNKKYLLTLNKFGISGTKKEVLEDAGFDLNTLVEICEKLLK